MIAPPSYTQFPNEILDNLAEFSAAELKVISVVYRETFGFHRDEALLTNPYLVERTGLSEQSVRNGVKGLIDKSLIERNFSQGGYIYRVKFLTPQNLDPLKSITPGVKNLGGRGQKSITPGVKNLGGGGASNADVPSAPETLNKPIKETSLNKPSKERERDALLNESSIAIPKVGSTSLLQPEENYLPLASHEAPVEMTVHEGDENSAAPQKNVFCEAEIEASTWPQFQAPWWDGINKLKPEFVRAVFESDRKYYGLDDGARQNPVHILKAVCNLERRARWYQGKTSDSDPLTARGVLLMHWQKAQELVVNKSVAIAPPPPPVVSSEIVVDPQERLAIFRAAREQYAKQQSSQPSAS